MSTKFSQFSIVTGIPDCNGYRALCWKILLGYLTPKKHDWTNILQKKRQLYKQFISKSSRKVNYPKIIIKTICIFR